MADKGGGVKRRNLIKKLEAAGYKKGKINFKSGGAEISPFLVNHAFKEVSVMAEYVYPAVFHPNEDGSFTVTYPDLPGCISEGKSLGNAMYMAQSA